MMETEQHRHYRRLPPSDQMPPGYIVGFCIKRDCPKPWQITPINEATVSAWGSESGITPAERVARGQVKRHATFAEKARQRTLAARRQRTSARTT